MTQKGFATIFGLCLILTIALMVKGLQEAEANHAREVSNFQTEQILQSAAESGLVEAAEFVRQSPAFLSEPTFFTNDKKKVLSTTKKFKYGGQTISVKVEVWGERGKIYINDDTKNVATKVITNGVYFMSFAAAKSKFWSGEVSRRAYAYVLSEKQADGTYMDHTTLHFMELP